MKTLPKPTGMPFVQPLAVAILSCVAIPAFAAVNDVLPGDYFPLATGTSTLAAYLYDRKGSGPYAGGEKVFSGKLDTQILALRMGHFFEVGGKPFSLVAVLPWAKATVSPPPLAGALGKEASGMGDFRLGATQWLQADRERGDYLAISAMLLLPTGDYERRQVISIGENHSKATLSLGWIKTLSPQFLLELTPEVAWYGDNDDYLNGYRLSQKSTTALTGYLRYRASPQWHFHVGGQRNWGGETAINGVARDDRSNMQRWTLGLTYFSDDRKHQWMLRAADETHVDNGFRTDQELLLRYLTTF